MIGTAATLVELVYALLEAGFFGESRILLIFLPPNSAASGPFSMSLGLTHRLLRS